MVGNEPATEFSWRVLLTVLAALGLAAGAFASLARRHVGRSAETAMADWARRAGFRRDRSGAVPAVLAGLAPGAVEVGRQYASSDGRTRVVRVWAGRPVGRWWHLLVRAGEGSAGPAVAGLRPVGGEGGRPASAVDWFGLPAFARLAPGHRFEVVGRDAGAARALAEGPARGLLPGDVGLVRGEGWVVLDFSGRAFEPVELSRVVAVAEQVEAGGRAGGVASPSPSGGGTDAQRQGEGD